MIRTGNPLRFPPATVFFSLPLGQAREISARVAAVVVTQARGGRELLDRTGHDALRDALAHEFPYLSGTDLFSVAADIGGSSHMLATIEWRAAGHRPGDTPEIGLSTLEGGLLIQLHASPGSVPAQLRAAAFANHATLYKHRFMRPPRPTNDAMRRSVELRRQHEQALYLYWQELEANPG